MRAQDFGRRRRAADHARVQQELDVLPPPSGRGLAQGIGEIGGAGEEVAAGLGPVLGDARHGNQKLPGGGMEDARDDGVVLDGLAVGRGTMASSLVS